MKQSVENDKQTTSLLALDDLKQLYNFYFFLQKKAHLK